MMTWRERAELTYGTDILGEDENGQLWLPSHTRQEWWDRRFNPRNPLHWPYWLRSRLTLRLSMIEIVDRS